MVIVLTAVMLHLNTARARDCRKPNSCSVCGDRHVTLLHSYTGVPIKRGTMQVPDDGCAVPWPLIYFCLPVIDGCLFLLAMMT